MASALGARPLAREVEALTKRARLDSASKRVAAEAPSAAASDREQDRLGLSDRELEVLALIAEGRTNRQIADALFITEKTAGHHVSNILAKLGLGSRVEAAAMAHRAGLV